MPATRSRLKTFVFVCAVSMAGTTALLLAGEVAVRIRWAIQHHDRGYLTLGIWGPDTRRGQTRTVAHESNSMSIWSDCAQGDISYRSNSAGGRGPEWEPKKLAGVVRLMAFGESNTWGAGNPEDLTWPAQLQRELRAVHGVSAEVLNWGQPGARLQGMLSLLPPVLDKFHPDVVLHYAGFNQTWSDTEVPKVLSFLNYRSMLYTYIYEKMYFRAEQSAQRLIPDTKKYEADFLSLVRLVRQHGSDLVVVAEATGAGAPDAARTACAAKWMDTTALRSCLGNLLEQPDPKYTKVQWARMLKNDVVQRLLLDAAVREHVFTIDPRSALADGEKLGRLFCDEAHLTTLGNSVLVRAVGGPLTDYLKTRASAHPGS